MQGTTKHSSLRLLYRCSPRSHSFKSPKTLNFLRFQHSQAKFVIHFEGPQNLPLRNAGEMIFHCEEEPWVVSPEKGGLGYIPLQLGDILNDGKYKIVRKLGFGCPTTDISSSWLAQEIGEPDESYVAIKILAPTSNADEDTQLAVLDAIKRDHKGNHPGRRFCFQSIDRFITESNYGNHICIVTEPYSGEFLWPLTETIIDQGRDPRAMLLPLVKNMVKKALVGLDYLHQLGFIHGDVIFQNFVIPIKGGDKDLVKLLRDSPAETYPPQHEPGLWSGPIVTTKSSPLPLLAFNLDLETVLSGFNCSVPISNAPPEMPKQRATHRAPEIILGHPYNEKVDVWAVGCMMLELLSHQPLFELNQTIEGDTIPANLDHLSQISQMTDSSFSSGFLDKCSKRTDYFDESGNLLKVSDHGSVVHEDDSSDKKYPPVQPTWDANSIHFRLSRVGILFPGELAIIKDFIQKATAIDPNERFTIAQLLAHEYLN